MQKLTGYLVMLGLCALLAGPAEARDYTRTVTGEGGKTATVQGSVNKKEDGKGWTRQETITRPDGSTATRSVDVTKTGDGQWERTVKGPRGERKSTHTRQKSN